MLKSGHDTPFTFYGFFICLQFISFIFNVLNFIKWEEKREKAILPEKV